MKKFSNILFLSLALIGFSSCGIFGGGNSEDERAEVDAKAQNQAELDSLKQENADVKYRLSVAEKRLSDLENSQQQ